MTEEEVIEMARQAGLNDVRFVPWYFEIQAFAKLVADKERNACAKYVEECSLPDSYSEACLLDIANELRARGEA